MHSLGNKVELIGPKDDDKGMAGQDIYSTEAGSDPLANNAITRKDDLNFDGEQRRRVLKCVRDRFNSLVAARCVGSTKCCVQSS